MPKATRPFADYCCELLASLGPCTVRAMFGGYGLSLDGMTLAIVADLGEGERLWLKADEDSRAVFEEAGCKRFTYDMGGVPKSMGYYTVPDEAMESPAEMRAWAHLAWQAALRAHQAKAAQASPKRGRATKPIAKRAKPAASRPPAPKAKPKAARKSAKA
jgi:DNA transformation protein